MKNLGQPIVHGLERALDHARAARRCGARGRRSGLPCRGPAMKNGRCRMHGGRSPGAPKGERNGRYRHGRWTAEHQALMTEARNLRKAVDASLDVLLGSLEARIAGRREPLA